MIHEYKAYKSETGKTYNRQVSIYYKDGNPALNIEPILWGKHDNYGGKHIGNGLYLFSGIREGEYELEVNGIIQWRQYIGDDMVFPAVTLSCKSCGSKDFDLTGKCNYCGNRK
jgi:hypothetical protein